MKILTQAGNDRIDRYYNAIADFRKKDSSSSSVKTLHGIGQNNWYIQKGFAVVDGKFYDFKENITRDDIKAAWGYAITKEVELPLEVINTIKDATTVESMHSNDLIKSSKLKEHWINLKNIKESDYFLARSFFSPHGILVFCLGTTNREVYIERTVNSSGHEEPHNLLKRTLYKFNPIRNTGKIYNRGSKGYWLIPVDCLDIVPPIEQLAPVEVIETVPVVNDEVVNNEVVTTTALSFKGDLAKSLFISMMNGRDMSGDPKDYSKLVRDSLYIAELLIYYDNKL